MITKAITKNVCSASIMLIGMHLGPISRNTDFLFSAAFFRLWGWFFIASLIMECAFGAVEMLEMKKEGDS